MGRSNKKTYYSLDNAACIDHILRAYVEEGHIGQTVRHYYYKLLSSGAIRLRMDKPNSTENASKFVSRLLNQARMEGKVPWEAVIDPGRRNQTYSFYESLQSYAYTESRSCYRLDPWRGQPRHLEVWVEKDGMANFLIDTTAHLRMPVYVNKGYGSATVIKDAAERYGNGKGWTLLYIGDFDPSGLDIERNMCDILSSHRCHPEIVRVSLTLEGTRALPQVAALDIKAKDTRSKKFWERYGREQKGYEVDAVPASQLQRMLLEKIHTYIDVSALNDALKLESMVQAEASKKLENAMSRFGNTILKSGIAECNLPYHKQMLYLADQKEL